MKINKEVWCITDRLMTFSFVVIIIMTCYKAKINDFDVCVKFIEKHLLCEMGR